MRITIQEILWEKYKKYKGIDAPEVEEVITQDFYQDGSGRSPRYYQQNAVNRTVEAIAKGQAPNLDKKVWKKAHSDDYEMGKKLFSSLQCVQCHAINRTGLGSKGPNLTLFGIRTSLAAGWMRNDEENLSKWLRNSNEVKFGNLMWNGEGVDDDHPLRNLENDDEKVNQLVTYLLGLK